MMRSNNLLAGLCVAAMTAISPLAMAAPSTGVATFDINALTSTLTGQTGGFSGWGYQSESEVTHTSLHDYSSTELALSGATAGQGKSHTSAGGLYTEAQMGAVSGAYQRVSATFELQAGQHFVYAIPYSITIHQKAAGDQINLGMSFTVESDDNWYNIYRTVGSQSPQHSGDLNESSYLLIDVTNHRSTALSYSIVGTLRAENLSTVSAVPEPASYAFLLAGLGLLAVAAKRRRGQI